MAERPAHAELYAAKEETETLGNKLNELAQRVSRLNNVSEGTGVNLVASKLRIARNKVWDAAQIMQAAEIEYLKNERRKK